MDVVEIVAGGVGLLWVARMRVVAGRRRYRGNCAMIDDFMVLGSSSRIHDLVARSVCHFMVVHTGD